MTAALPALNELIARLGAELDFDVARNVEVARGAVDVVWFDRSLPLAAVAAEPLDLRDAPVLPVVAFVALTAPELEDSELAAVTARMEDTGAPLRILVIGRTSRPGALAPALQSVDQLRKREDEATAARTHMSPRVATHRCARAGTHDRHAAGRARRMGAAPARSAAAFVFRRDAVQPHRRDRLSVEGAAKIFRFARRRSRRAARGGRCRR